MGYKLAGYDVVMANDIDPEMAWHYKRNLNPKHYALCPVKELSNLLPEDVYGIDLLDGSPPCSTFSMAGLREKAWGKEKCFREGQAVQVLDDLFFDFIDLADKVRPRAIIAENVSGLVKGNAKGYVRMIFERLRKAGYRPQIFLIDASRCGVPQRRERVFVCAQRDDLPARKLTISATSPIVSIGEACSDLVTDISERGVAPTKMDLDWWHKTSPGDGYDSAVVKDGLKSKFWNHIRISKDRPCATLTAHYDVTKHWSECRRLTLAEWKRAGSFPDDYEARDPIIGKYMIGMSVPPKMAKVVGAAVAEQWLL